VIVVVDGLHRIATNDSSPANLAWLPLELPPGVRFVISATTPTVAEIQKLRVEAERKRSIMTERTSNSKNVPTAQLMTAVAAALTNESDDEDLRDRYLTQTLHPTLTLT
jgi:hypothetical protein